MKGSRALCVLSVMTLLVLSSIVIALSLNNSRVTSPDSQADNQEVQKKYEPSKKVEYNSSVSFARQMVIYNQQAIDISETFLSKKSSEDTLNDVVNEDLTYHKISAKNYIQWLDDEKQSYLNLSDFERVDIHDGYPTNPGMPSVAQLNAFAKASEKESKKTLLELQYSLHNGSKAHIDTNSKNIRNKVLLQYIDSNQRHYMAAINTLKELLKLR